MPYELEFFIRDLPKDIKRKIILKIKLKARDSKTYIEAESLMEAGYKIAVDIQDKRSLLSIPHNAHFIIIDSLFMSLIDELDRVLLDNTKLIIKNIDNYDTFEALENEGIQYFSGPFIETPKTVTEKVMSSNKVTVLKLISTLNDPDVELEEVSKIISLDNIMSYKLLKIINSPLFRGVNKLTSIQDAIIRFGYTNLKKWGLTLSLTNLTDKPNELTKLTLERAIMCSNIAEALSKSNNTNKDSFYTAGLFSTLDAFFDTPMQTLLENISLEESVRNGILNYQGDTGQVLKKVIDYQRGLILPEDSKLSDIYIESSEEAQKTIKILGLD